MDMSLYLILIIVVAAAVVMLILMNTSILWNQGLRETWHEIRDLYFGKRDQLDSTPNPRLKDLDLPPDEPEPDLNNQKNDDESD